MILLVTGQNNLQVYHYVFHKVIEFNLRNLLIWIKGLNIILIYLHLLGLVHTRVRKILV